MLFINCTSEVNNTPADMTKDNDVVMPMQNLLENNANFSKILGSLWQNCKNEPNDNVTDSESFILKLKITGNTNAAGIKNIILTVPSKYLTSFLKCPLSSEKLFLF